MTPFALAQRFVGQVLEIPGEQHSPFIQWCLESCGFGPETPDEVPWCSAFVNRICWILSLPRTKSAMARSWLRMGMVIDDPTPGWDIVILKRGGGNQPGPHVLDAPGHVGFFAGFEGTRVLILGGNQSDAVNIQAYPQSKVIGYRRLHPGMS